MMNNSFKFFKYIFYILMIISLLFGIKSKVYALNIDSYWLTTSTSGWFTDTGSTYSTIFSNVNGSIYKELVPNNINLSGNDYLQINASLYITNTTDSSLINLNSINLNETCTQYGQGGGTNPIQGSITYQDGTQASIDLATINRLCQAWQSTGSSSGTETYNIRGNTILNVGITMLNSNNQENVFWCTNTGGSSYTCPIPSGWTFEKLSFFGNLGGASANYKIMVARNMYMYKSDTQTIINNNNQNTNTINNSIQDTNNTLKDDNINGNNSNDTISSIGNTFDTENDFLLGLLTIPYNFFNSLVNIFENNCTSLNLGSMFGKDLVFPCLSLSNLLGNVFTNVIDVIFCGVIMSAFLRRIVKYYQALLSLDERATQIGGVKIW